MDASGWDRHVATRGQASPNAHSVGRYRRREAKLSVEPGPHSRDDADGAEHDGRETHHGRHPDAHDEEGVEDAQPDSDGEGQDRAHGGEHGANEFEYAHAEDDAFGCLKRRLGEGTPLPRRAGRAGGRDKLVDRSGGEAQQERAQLFEAARGKQAELDARLRSARYLNIEVAQADDAPQEGIGEVDGLDARDPGVALRTRQDAGTEPHGARGDRITGHPPREVAKGQEHADRDESQAEEHRERADTRRPRGSALPDNASPAPLKRPDGCRCDAAEGTGNTRQIGERVEVLPVLGGNTVGGEVRAHRPISSAEPRSANTSRRRDASATGTPASAASVCALAVDSLMVAIPRRRCTGPWAMSTYWMRP